jgi:fucose permease
MPNRIPIRRAVIASFALYVVFGLPDGVFGTIWPNLRDDFGRSDSSLGLLILAMALGYSVGGLASGHLAERFAVGRLLPVAMTVAGIGLLTIGLAGDWWFVMAGYLILGFCWGIADAALNSWMTITQGPREMGLLHGSYGVGAFLGPLLATVFVADGAAWRAPLVVCAALTLVAVAMLVVARSGFALATTTPEVAAKTTPADGDNRVMVLMIVWFVVYAGIEVALGSWVYTLLTEGRDYTDVSAGVITALYWGGIMAGRFVLAAFGNRTHPERTLWATTTIVIASLLYLWVDIGGTGGLVLPIIGLALAPMFPVMIGRTGVYLGAARATRAVGYQIGATAIGFTSIPTLIGLLADRYDVGVAAPVVLATALALALIWITIERSVGQSMGVVQEPAADDTPAPRRA